MDELTIEIDRESALKVGAAGALATIAAMFGSTAEAGAKPILINGTPLGLDYTSGQSHARNKKALKTCSAAAYHVMISDRLIVSPNPAPDYQFTIAKAAVKWHDRNGSSGDDPDLGTVYVYVWLTNPCA